MILWIPRLAPVRLVLPDGPDDRPTKTLGNDNESEPIRQDFNNNYQLINHKMIEIHSSYLRYNTQLIIWI
jgi:hypothetical protein